MQSMGWGALEPQRAADSQVEDEQTAGSDLTSFEVVLGLGTQATVRPLYFFLSPPAFTSIAQKQTHPLTHFNVTSLLQLAPPHATPHFTPMLRKFSGF